MRRGKYNAKPTDGYASQREARVAAKLIALEEAGKIHSLKFQVPFTLVEGEGRVRPIKYVADFTFWENGLPFRSGSRFVVADAKGYRTKEYAIKKKLMYLLLGYEIEEM